MCLPSGVGASWWVPWQTSSPTILFSRSAPWCRPAQTLLEARSSSRCWWTSCWSLSGLRGDTGGQRTQHCFTSDPFVPYWCQMGNQWIQSERRFRTVVVNTVSSDDIFSFKGLNRSTRRKPRRHEENIQTRCKINLMLRGAAGRLKEYFTGD